MIRLVCIDVDGTLVGSAGAVDPAVWRAAARVRSAGIRLAICSGRPAFGLAREYAGRLDGAGWHSFQNGASVLHLASGRSRSARMGEEIVAMLVARARATGRLLELYADDDYVFHGDEALARSHAALLGVPFATRPLDALAGPVVRAQWLVPRAESAAVIGEPHPGLQVSPSTSPLMPDTHFLNLTPAGVDKSTAVRAIAGEYGVSLEEVMFVGDGANDAAAMRLVGHPVAMGNADAEAREAARCTVAHVDEGGLAQALEMVLAS
ncbi:MAG TPA: HAD hydrolase family protein [Gemmatimonadaceae bacterium]|nr:HAD hydrolase family protein [Gemmatimonadaceae bacterium]